MLQSPSQLVRRAAFASGSSTVIELHKAIGLHDAMYLIPVLDAVLVVVLFAASRTVKNDYLRLRERMEAARCEGGSASSDP